MSLKLIAGLSIIFTGAALADPAALPAASSDPPASQLCKVNTTDIPVAAYGRNIQAIVTRYGADPQCSLRLRSALENIFREEHRSEAWAGPLERMIADAAAAVPGAKVTGGCHTSLCRYDIELTARVESARSPNEVDRRVIDAATATPFEVASVHYGSTFKRRSYFYSLVAPAEFLEPLRRIMDAADALSHKERE